MVLKEQNSQAQYECTRPQLYTRGLQVLTEVFRGFTSPAPGPDGEDMTAEWDKALRDLVTGVVAEGKDPSGDIAKMRAAEQRLKFLNKPPDFDGTGNFVEWRDKMDHFMTVLNLPSSEEVSVATSYLRGGALSWWKTEYKRQQQDMYASEPEDWSDLLNLLNARYDHLNPVLAARTKLETLKQGSMSLQQYLTEFESCYAHIPNADEEDKSFRFTFHMRPDLQQRFAVNPLTQRRWDNWPSMVTYLSAYLSDAACAEVRREVQKGFNGGGSSSAGNGGGNNPGLKAKGGVRKPGKGPKPNNGNGNPKGPGKTLTTPTTRDMANGQVTRPWNEWGYCLANNLCFGCYKKDTHQVKQCPGPKANGTPPGYSHDWVYNLPKDQQTKWKSFVAK